MTTIVVAVVGGVATLLAAFAPFFLTSERRTLVRLIKEESEALANVDDDEAKLLMTEALRSSTQRYRSLARRTQVDRTLHQMYLAMIPSTAAIIFGVSLMVLAPTRDMTDKAETAFVIVGSGLVAVGVFVLGLMLVRVRYATREESREKAELADEKARREAAESTIDEAAELVQALVPAHAGKNTLSWAEVSALSKLLEGSKAARARVTLSRFDKDFRPDVQRVDDPSDEDPRLK